jgi:mono/diheme cytochrome c family protein
MTDHGTSKKSSALREYAIVALLILIGTPLAVWWGHKDGLELAARAYDGTEASGTDEDGGDYEDYEEEGGEEAAGDASVPEASEEAIARGAALFQTHCVACHGAAADGKGPAAVAFTPPPRNFTDPEAKWTLGREPAQIHAAVSKGIEGTGMAGFAAVLSAEELWDVVHYLGSLPGVSGAGGR